MPVMHRGMTAAAIERFVNQRIIDVDVYGNVNANVNENHDEGDFNVGGDVPVARAVDLTLGEMKFRSALEKRDRWERKGKSCEKNYSSMKRCVADPVNVSPNGKSLSLILKKQLYLMWYPTISAVHLIIISLGKLIQKLLLNQKCIGYLVRAYYSISPTRLEVKDHRRHHRHWKTIEDIISIGSFMEVRVLNQYVLVRKILTLGFLGTTICLSLRGKLGLQFKTIDGVARELEELRARMANANIEAHRSNDAQHSLSFMYLSIGTMNFHKWTSLSSSFYDVLLFTRLSYFSFKYYSCDDVESNIVSYCRAVNDVSLESEMKEDNHRPFAMPDIQGSWHVQAHLPSFPLSERQMVVLRNPNVL
nr:SNF2-related, N-terminal domain-containing protein [Tanacetum cinerariifolium]